MWWKDRTLSRIAARPSRVFTVRIQEEKRVDHAVVMDAKNGSLSIQRSERHLSFRLKILPGAKGTVRSSFE